MRRKFILGTDWWTDCDDAVALRLLVGAHLQKKIEILGIVINAAMEYSVASLDGFLRLEGCDDIDIAIDRAATDFGGRPPYQERLVPSAKRYFRNDDAEDAVRAYRRILANADGPVEIIEIGFPSAIADALASGGDDLSEKVGVELFCEKVSHVWVMAGKWDKDGERENNFARNNRARVGASRFLELCPTEITFLGWEVGADVYTGGNLSHDDHLHLALKDHGSASGRSSWDPMLAEMALVGDIRAAGYEPVYGRASVDATDGRNHFEEFCGGPHAYVRRAFPKEYYEKKINALIER
jgi:hypothetical protein